MGVFNGFKIVQMLVNGAKRHLPFSAHSLVVSDLRSDTKDSQIKSGCQLYAQR